MKVSSKHLEKLNVSSSRQPAIYLGILCLYDANGGIHEFCRQSVWSLVRQEEPKHEAARKLLILALKETEVPGEICTCTTVEYLVQLLETKYLSLWRCIATTAATTTTTPNVTLKSTMIAVQRELHLDASCCHKWYASCRVCYLQQWPCRYEYFACHQREWSHVYRERQPMCSGQKIHWRCWRY